MQVPNERGSKTFLSKQYLSNKKMQTITMFWFLIVFISFALMTHFVDASVYSRIPDYCRQPPPRSEGYCTIAIEGYYYDPRTNDCHRYEVGGCRSIPGQSFGSREDCLATCIYMTRSMQEYRV